MKRPTLRELFDRHLRQVLRAVRRSGVPERYAEDVAQDVFEAVHVALPKYDSRQPIEPWLLTIAYRTAIDHQRRAMHREQPVATDEIVVLDTRLDPERIAQHREAARLFDQIVAGLDPDQRTVYLLHEIEDLPVAEIAVTLGIAEGTAASRLQRGRARFDEGLARARAAEQRRAGAMFLPLFLADPEALLKAARTFPAITADMASRVWGKVSIATAGAAAATATGAVVATAARLVSLTHAQIMMGLAAAAFAGAALSGALVFAVTHPAARAVTGPGVVAEPSRSGPAGGPAPADVTADPSPSSPTSGPSTTAGSTIAPSPGADAATTERAEMALLDRARAALARGDAVGAIRELERHRRTYPRGVYSEEREALIARATTAAAGQDGGSL